jgi:hypothetical protein
VLGLNGEAVLGLNGEGATLGSSDVLGLNAEAWLGLNVDALALGLAGDGELLGMLVLALRLRLGDGQRCVGSLCSIPHGLALMLVTSSLVLIVVEKMPDASINFGTTGGVPKLGS